MVFQFFFPFQQTFATFAKIKNWWEKWCRTTVNWKKKWRNYNFVEQKNVILAFGAERSTMTKKGLFLIKA
jgi:hypothetical protein